MAFKKNRQFVLCAILPKVHWERLTVSYPTVPELREALHSSANGMWVWVFQ